MMKYVILTSFLTFFISLFACGDFDKAVQENKRFNFDVCAKQCMTLGTTIKKFEQGLGYVTCECYEK